MDNKEGLGGGGDIQKTVVKLHDLKKTHDIIDALGFSVDITYAPRMVPLDKISHDLESFQNRKKPYSEHSVQNIIDAVLRGEFDLRIFNPLILRREEKNNTLYILGGHSRYEAFKRLSTTYKDDEHVQAFFKKHGYDFGQIPSLIMDDINFDNAKFVALMSNALATVETDTERAEIYRAFRQLGKDKKFIDEFGKKCEKLNRPRINAYAHLNPNGGMTQTLESFEVGSDESNIIKRVGLRLGNIRKKYPELTNAHEEELYDRLLHKGGYGTQKGQVNNQTKCLDTVGKLIERLKHNGIFNEKEPLNILKVPDFSVAMQEYYKIEDEFKQKKKKLYSDFHDVRRTINKHQIEKGSGNVHELNQALKDIIKHPINVVDDMEKLQEVLFSTKEFINNDNIEEIKNKVLDTINTIEQKYYKHKAKKEDFIKAGKSELKLTFD